MRSREELAWAAGLFDGEGCFTFRPHITKGNRFVATIVMNDRDLIERFGRVIGFGNIGPVVRRRGDHTTTMWRWRVASFQHVQALIAFTWTWLGERRRAKCRDLLQYGARFYSNGLPKAPAWSRNGRTKLTNAQVTEIRKLRAAGLRLADVAQHFPITAGYVSDLCIRSRRAAV